MKTTKNLIAAGLLTSLLVFMPSVLQGQSEKAFTRKYLSELPKIDLSS